MLVRTFDTGLGLEGVHVLVTGGNGQIGSVVVEAFLASGSYVTIIDSSEHCPHAEQANLFVLKGDITQDLTTLLIYAEERFGVVQVCIALAGLDLSFLTETDSICDADPLAWKRVFDVNIHGTFNTCQAWLRRIREASSQPDAANKLRNVSLIIVGSEAGRDGVRTMAAYAAGKSAVQYGLLASLAKDVPRIWNNGRVNAIAPGAVDTPMFREEVGRLGKDYLYSSCEATAPLPGPVSIECVARTILFLSSSRYSGNVHGQLVHIDNGKSGPLAYAPGECPAYSLS